MLCPSSRTLCGAARLQRVCVVTATALTLLSGLAGLSSAPDSAHAADVPRGRLTGRFVFDGPVPERRPISFDKDVEFCTKAGTLTEDLLVDPKSGGLANVVVTLELQRGETLPPDYPEHAELAEAEVTLTNKGCRFEPRITVLRTSQTLRLGNDDRIPHNTVAFLFLNTPFNEAIGPGLSVTKKLHRGETRPVQISCPIHAWMKGFLIVREHPFVGVSGPDGTFEIPHLPAGDWTFQFWHEASGYLTKLPLKSGTVEDRRGRYRLTVAPGETSLGDIRLPAALFE